MTAAVCEMAAPFVANSAVEGRAVVRPFRSHVSSCLKCQARHAAMTKTELPFDVVVTPNGRTTTVKLRANDPTDAVAVAKVRGLGFVGWLASGGHHQMHHLGIAKGEAVHSH